MDNELECALPDSPLLPTELYNPTNPAPAGGIRPFHTRIPDMPIVADGALRTPPSSPAIEVADHCFKMVVIPATPVLVREINSCAPLWKDESDGYSIFTESGQSLIPKDTWSLLWIQLRFRIWTYTPQQMMADEFFDPPHICIQVVVLLLLLLLPCLGLAFSSCLVKVIFSA